uniref:L-lactate dehydrogenase B-like n=1 Tax=Dermatophagoides pteronyssinus TaxID=6956 RepID=A0A6P6Y7R1_DERPT
DGYYRTFFREECQLGRGAFGQVFLCHHFLERIKLGTFAVKKIPVGDSLENLQAMIREVKMRESLSHQNIVSYKHSWLELLQGAALESVPVPWLFVLMEYCAGGSVEEVLRNTYEVEQSSLTDSEVWLIFHDIISGLQHLHHKGIVHRDLKPSNIVLKHAQVYACLADFGTSDYISSSRSGLGYTGSLEYTAPELLRADASGRFVERYRFENDMFSCGLILHALAFGQLPFEPKIVIVGAGGMVGASTTFSIALKRIPCDIVMVDVAEKLVQGQCADIQDALTDTVATVRVGTFSDIADATLMIVTAGLKQQPGEPRSALLRRNLKVLKSICSHVDKERSPQLCIMMVSNPVDVLTYAAQKFTGLPRAQVFGSGTVLDTRRLRGFVAKRLDVDQRHCHVNVVGEHGDKQVAVWSSSTICGESIEKFCAARGICAKQLAEETMKRAYEIIENKGATYFAIGATVADVLHNLLYAKASIQ